MSTEQVIEYTDADTGEAFQQDVWTKEMRPGEISTKRINIKNIHAIYPIRLVNPRTNGLRILTYPNDLEDDHDVIRPGESRTMDLEVDVPKEQITPPKTSWDFDIAVIAFG